MDSDNSSERIDMEAEKKESPKNPELVFQDYLQNIIKTQEDIIKKTGEANEKLKNTNVIIQDQIENFKMHSERYGKYLILIKNELQLISDTMKKIKQLEKERESKEKEKELKDIKDKGEGK